MTPVVSAGSEGGRCPCSSNLLQWGTFPGSSLTHLQEWIGDKEWTWVGMIWWAGYAVLSKRFLRSPHSDRGNALIWHSIPLASTSIPGPLTLSLPRLQCLPPGRTRRFTPSGSGSMNHPEYLYLSSASGHSYQAARPRWLGGGQIHGRHIYCTLRGLDLGGGAVCDAVAVALCVDGRYHDI